MTLRFEVGASVTLVGQDLQFVGMDEGARIRFIIENAALKRVADTVKELTQQQKFKVYDRNREWFQEAARSLYERKPSHAVKITVADL